MDVNKIIILYIILLNYQEQEVVDEEEEVDEQEELLFLHPLDFALHGLHFFDFSSHGLQSNELLEEQEHGFDVVQEEDEHDQPDEVQHELLEWHDL